MTRRIRYLAAAFGVLYLLVFVQLNRIQFFGAERLREDPVNTRGLVREFGRRRGAIVTADGVVAARSVPAPNTGGEFRREYPTGDLYAHLTGYQSLTVGAVGLERAFDDELAGRVVTQRFRSLRDLLVDRDATATVVMTVDDEVQRAARDALGERRGSVVALDPRTGAVLASWTWPSFDPGPLASPDGATANAAYEALLDDPDDPLLAKAFREVFFPGSTFKLVTASAGLASGRVGPHTPVFPETDRYEPLPSGSPIRNFGGATCGGDLFEILRVSCNTAFAEMGAEWIGPADMIATAQAYGFGTAPPFDVPGAVASRFPTDYGAPLATVADYRAGPGEVLVNGDVPVFENSARLAQAAIGQNDVAATPLQMALVAAAIAHGGEIMAPHVVAELRGADGTVYRRTEPRAWRRAVSAPVAATLREAMIGVVEGGTARRLAIEGLEVGGKTGTAQLGTDPPRSHAWIVAFAGPPGGEPEIAVAVIVEGQQGASEQTGGRVAAPVARAVIEAALEP
ncbi:MAG: penicillin-binding protein 2 [Actinomyces sp.]|nr:MAG: penicillin-binding protein 2 [Actinomyces sp.]